MVVRLVSTACRASAQRCVGLTISCEGLPQQVRAQLRVDIKSLEAPILLLELLHPRHQRDIHAPELGVPLVELAELIPCVRQSSGTGMPPSASFRTAMIWLSVNRDVFMGTSSDQCTRTFHFGRPCYSGGITARDVPRVASHRSDLTRQAVACRRRAQGAPLGPDVMTFPVAATAVVPGADEPRRYESLRTDRRDHRRYAFSVVADGSLAVVPRAPRSRRHLPPALDGAEPPRCLWSPHPSRNFSWFATARRARSVPLALVF